LQGLISESEKKILRKRRRKERSRRRKGRRRKEEGDSLTKERLNELKGNVA